MAFRVCDGQVGGGAFLIELLVAALHGAVALPEVEGVAVQVGDDLDLDVAGMLEVLFEVDLGAAEGGLRLGLGLVQGRLQGQFVGGHPHAAAAAARRGLDQHRKPNCWANCKAWASPSISPSLPGTVGTSACRAILRAEFLSPSMAIASGGDR